VEADLAMQEEALKKIAPNLAPPQRFQADDSLLAFLDSLSEKLPSAGVPAAWPYLVENDASN
jgi:hypothetical protein